MSAKKKKTPAKKTSGKSSANKKKASSSKETLIEEEKYDSVPYESYVYPRTHPQHLYTIGKLFRMEPVDVSKARVLELGCGCGGNLTPLALKYPKSQCVGVDLSGEQITIANREKAGLKIKNIEFLQRDIAKLEKDLGEFDYIMCHGVLSWVPDKVRKAIFEVCRRHLSKNGLAVISYNTLPGWSAVRSLRDMMVYHTQRFTDPAQQIREARALLNFLYDNAPDANKSYKEVIDRERKILNNTNDTYIFHEHLEAVNNQFYLHEFVSEANSHDLAYVGDAEISSMYLGNFNKQVQQTLSAITDIVRQEQYIDFLTNRRFRHSIITHTENAQTISRNLQGEDVFDFYIHAMYKPEKETVPKDNQMTFSKSGGGSFNTHDKKTTTLFMELAAAGKPVKPDALVKAVQKKLKLKKPDELREVITKNIMPLALQNMIGLHADTHNALRKVSKKPKAFELARYQARNRTSSICQVTSLGNETVKLDVAGYTLLAHLDGKSDLKALTKKMVEHAQADDISVAREGKKIDDPAELEKILSQYTQQTLETLARNNLLES